MGNQFDSEFDRVAHEEHAASGALVRARAADRLQRLRSELQTSSKAQEGVLDCIVEDETLLVRVMGQPVGEWTNEDHTLTLYRAGAPTPECRATSVAEAVKLTARLVAAVSQA
jgi:hypothetical protein